VTEVAARRTTGDDLDAQRLVAAMTAETGALYGGVLYVDSLSEETGPVPTFLKLLETTVATIAEGFGA